ncbi:unnamed protein product, partial [Linum tenue]
MRVPPSNGHKYAIEFESTPASRLVIRTYEDAFKDTMHIFLRKRKPVPYVRLDTGEKL